MKELKKGDFTGIYSSIDGKPLYFTGVYSCMEYDGMPCVFLATDLHNNLTFCRWSQQDLNKRGFTIPPEPVRISKTAMQMIQKAGAGIRWTTAAERKAANTDHKRMSAYIITTAAGDFYTTGTCADVREILKAAQAAPKESTPATEANQHTTTGAQESTTTAATTPDGETPTEAEAEPQNATESAEKTAGDTEPQRAAQTDRTSKGEETTAPPHTEPPRATDAAGGSVSQSDRRTRPAAPQSHGTTKGIQRHHRPPKTAYRAIQRAATTPPSAQKTTFSAWMHKTGSDPPKIYVYPIFDKDFPRN